MTLQKSSCAIIVVVLQTGMDKLNTWIKAERGRLTKLALAIKVTPGAITQWSKVPADRVVKVSEVTDIPRQELRPDLYEGMEAAE